MRTTLGSMSRETDAVLGAIDRWEAASVIGASTAADLRGEVASHTATSTRRMSQYVLAVTGGVILVMAGGVFLDWAWPMLGERVRTAVLAVGGIGVVVGGVAMEARHRWRPASYLLQTAGLLLILGAYIYSERHWVDQSLGGTVIGLFALVTPIVMAGRAFGRDVVMPAIHLALGFAFLAVFLDRSTPLSGEATMWALDLVLLGAIVTLVRLLLGDPDGDRHPWALNAFVGALFAGFFLVVPTSTVLLSVDVWLPLDAWLALTVATTLWGIHRAPEGLRRGWFGRVLALEALVWIFLGMGTAYDEFSRSLELGVILVSGAGVVAFLYGERQGFRQLMAVAALSFVFPIWWWSIDRGGALGGVGGLLLTAAFLFWASGRSGMRQTTQS